MNEKICGDSIRVVHPLFQTEDGGSIPTSPLQFHIGQISLDLAINLNLLWHSRLPVVSRSNMIRTKHLICFGAECGNLWYASAIWTNPIARRLNNKPWLELRRLAIAPDAPKNTASRMIRVMTNQVRRTYPNIKRLISYQDEDVHTGAIYKASGWSATTRHENIEGWNTRKRNETQAPSPKTRWENEL